MPSGYARGRVRHLIHGDADRFPDRRFVEEGSFVAATLELLADVGERSASAASLA